MQSIYWFRKNFPWMEIQKYKSQNLLKLSLFLKQQSSFIHENTLCSTFTQISCSKCTPKRSRCPAFTDHVRTGRHVCESQTRASPEEEHEIPFETHHKAAPNTGKPLFVPWAQTSSLPADKSSVWEIQKSEIKHTSYLSAHYQSGSKTSELLQHVRYSYLSHARAPTPTPPHPHLGCVW